MGALRLGTGGNALALVQTEWVARRLGAAGIATQMVPVPDAGDGYSALRSALVTGGIDVAVRPRSALPGKIDVNRTPT